MKFTKLSIDGAWLIEPELISDDRGIFRRHFCKDEYEELGLDSHVMQANVSENPHLHTLRGFHYQLPPHAEGKTISCMSGSLYDIIVDLRQDSPTYLKWEPLTIRAEDRNALYVPPGCANAYLTMESNTIVHYYMTESYKPDAYRGFYYNDPFFDFKWPFPPKLISDKDKNLPSYTPG